MLLNKNKQALLVLSLNLRQKYTCMESPIQGEHIGASPISINSCIRKLQPYNKTCVIFIDIVTLKYIQVDASNIQSYVYLKSYGA